MHDEQRFEASRERPAVHGALREARGTGRPLEGVARRRIESAFGIGLGPVRLHQDASADVLCRAIGVDAFTTGADVYLRADRDPVGDDRGLRLLAHEAAHVVQQARTADPWSVDLAALEAEAEALALRAVLGVRWPSVGAALPPVDRPVPWIQGHGSWEHSLFGDASVQELVAIAADAPDQAKRTRILTTVQSMVGLWKAGPGAATAADVQERWPGRRLFQPPANNVLFTYGELNALPDYVANAGAIGTMSQAMLGRILQSVRQESFNKLKGLIGSTTPIVGGPTMFLQAWANTAPEDFTGAASLSYRFATVNLIMETRDLDSLTASLLTNRYLALVARNACHFAPFSWYRWRDTFAVAQDLARRSHAAANPGDRQSLATAAWMQAGYSAHFLQDSFAAGHLVNKTLVMQWFVDWATKGVWGPIYDWDTLLTMTVAHQPGIAAPALYDPSPDFQAFIAPVRDPQTAEEGTTRGTRMALSGTQPDGNIDELQAYMNFLTFMSNPAAQSASGAVHDYFNAHSLQVASVAHPAPFTVWGDDTMLLGGEGIEIASETTHLTEVSIMQLIETGKTEFTINEIFRHFPTKAALPSGAMVGLRDWQYSDEVKALVRTIFPSAHYYATQLGGRLPNVSRDLGTGNQR